MNLLQLSNQDSKLKKLKPVKDGHTFDRRHRRHLRDLDDFAVRCHVKVRHLTFVHSLLSRVNHGTFWTEMVNC